MKKSTKNWGFDLRDRDLSVRPQDDFYKYASGTWLKKTKIPANESRWGSFVILRVETEKQLKRIVDDLAKQPRRKVGVPTNASGMIRDFYRSGMDEAAREKVGIAPLKPWLARIEKLKDKNDLVKLLADLEKIGLGGIWGLHIDQDAKDSTRYALHLYQGGLGLPDRDYYLKDDAESKRVRDAYVKHIEAIHRLLGLSASEARAAREVVMRIETALAKASMTREDTRDADKIYHKLSLAALEKQAPGIGWKQYLKAAGVPDLRTIIAMQPEFLKAVSAMLESVSPAEWKTYLSYHLVNDAAGALSKKFVRENFAFYATVLAGTKKMKPLWRRALGATNGSLSELLGQLYVEKHFTPAAKARMNELVDDLFAAYEARIQNIDWMTPATKKKALAKLKLMSRKIGYPDTWKSYAGLVVRSDDYFGNLLRAGQYERRRQLRKLGRPVDHDEWFMPPQLVNAYHSSNLNDIAFPAAILQPPFFGLTADDAINYGSIGSVIGHEITHGFDDQGAKFDGYGNLKPWWTGEDKKRFEQKARVVKQQFDQYTVADGVPVNGQLTLGENIADLGGVSIAYDAYQRHLARTGTRKNIDGLTPEQRFFLGFALFERELTRPEFIKMLVLTDPHSPGIFRINGPASNLPEFYAAYGVKKGDKLYREPKARAKIW